MELVLLVIIGLAVVYKLGLFAPISDLAEVATIESSKYKRLHKAEVLEEYQKESEKEIDVEKINAYIKKIDEIKLD